MDPTQLASNPTRSGWNAEEIVPETPPSVPVRFPQGRFISLTDAATKQSTPVASTSANANPSPPSPSDQDAGVEEPITTSKAVPSTNRPIPRPIITPVPIQTTLGESITESSSPPVPVTTKKKPAKRYPHR